MIFRKLNKSEDLVKDRYERTISINLKQRNLSNLIKEIIPETKALSDEELIAMWWAFIKIVWDNATSQQIEEALKEQINPYSLFRKNYHKYFLKIYIKEIFQKIQKYILLNSEDYGFEKGFLGFDVSKLEEEHILSVVEGIATNK